MHFAVLGTLEVRDADGVLVPITSPTRRRLLAALLCRANRPVPAETLIADIWGPLPPRSAAKTLHSHVTRLRDDLGRSSAPIRTEAAGYRLDTGDAQVDAIRFEQQLRELRREVSGPSVGRLDDALGLWRDEAYLEFGDAAFAVGERIRLTGLRSAAEDERVDLLMATGRAADVVAELEARVGAEPYRERGWEQLVLALYRCSRQADALGAFRRARDLLATDLGVDPGPGLRELEARILRHDESLLAPVAPPPPHRLRSAECPYRGLTGYRDTDKDLFVGRERLTAELAGSLADQPAVLVTGASGCGKSSLLRAGLLPALRSGALPGSAMWRSEVVTPATYGLLSGMPNVVVLDQAEDLFTVLDGAAARTLAADLAERMDAGSRLVVALRGDYFDRLAELPQLSALVGNTVLVRSLRDDEIRRVIIEPARRVGLDVEPAVVDTVLDDVSGRPGALPLMSAALVRTWMNRERHGDSERLTLAGYQHGGGFAAAIEAGAEDSFLALAPDTQAAARRVLLRLVARVGGTWVRRPAAIDEVRDAGSDAALSALVTERLLTVDDGRVEVVHDALLTAWPRLGGWLDERERAAGLLDHLATAARAWNLAGRSDADVYRGTRLQAALDWVDDHRDDAGPGEHEFLDASRRAAHAELDAARRRGDEEAAGRRRLRRAVVGLVAALVLAIAGGIVALAARNDAQRQTRLAAAAALTADARRLAAESLTAPDLRTGLLLAVAAYRLQDSPDSRSALLTELDRNGAATWRITTANRVATVVTDRTGDTVWVGDFDGHVLRYDRITRRLLGTLDIEESADLAVSPDGSLLVGSPGDSATGELVVADARTGAVRHAFPAGSPEDVDSVHRMHFSPDGHRLAVLNWTQGNTTTFPKQVDVFDARRLSAAPTVIHADAPVVGMDVGTHEVALLTDRNEVELADVVTGRITYRHTVPGSFPVDDGYGAVFAASPDGSHVAIGTADGVELLDTARAHAAPYAAQLPVQSYNVLAFSPNGRSLAVGGGSGAVAVVATATGSSAADLPGENGSVTGVAWAGPAPGTTADQLFTGGLDSQLVSWDLQSGPRLLTLHGADFPLQVGGTSGSAGSGTEPRPTYFGGTGTPANERLVVTDFARRTETSWPLRLRPGDSLLSFGGDATRRSRELVCVEQTVGRRCDLWNLRTHVRLNSIAVTAADPDSGFGALNRDGTTAAIATGREAVTFYRLPGFTRLRTIRVSLRGRLADTQVEPEEFAPDGRLVVEGAGSDDTGVAAIDPFTGADTGQVDFGTGGDLESIDWSHAGNRVVAGTSGGRVWLLDARTLAPIANVSAISGFVLTTEFSPDDRTIVVGGTDSTMSLFDAATLRRLGTPISLPGSDWDEATYDGRGDEIAGLTSVSHSQQRFFTFPGDPHAWVRVACSIADSELTDAEWRYYVGDRPYVAVCAT